MGSMFERARDWLRGVQPAPEPAGAGVVTNTFAQRHAYLAQGYGSAPDPEDPADVWAMQVVLRIEKHDPPARSAVLSAAASAAVALCLDERSGPGGEWEHAVRTWARARIRKVSRRARGKQWQDAGQVPGLTVEYDGAQARAFVPGRVGDLDPRVKKLQISGTDLPADDPRPAGDRLPVMWVDERLGMTTGKAAAQVGHAAMLLAGAMSFAQAHAWAQRDYACTVRDASPEHWARLAEAVRAGEAVAVRDAGFTEVAPGSMTVIAQPGRLG